MPAEPARRFVVGSGGRRQATILLPECQMSRHLLVKSATPLVALVHHSPQSQVSPMIRTAFCLFALGGLCPVLAAPASNTLSHSVGTELVLPLGSLPERVCWYQDQKYSLGARIQQGDLWLECAPQNVQESNGPLVWREPAVLQPLDEDASNKVTIRVGQ